MMPRSLVLSALIALGCDATEPSHCRDAHAGRVTLFVDSTIGTGHRVLQGKPANCSSEPELFAKLVPVLAAMPSELVPDRVVVHVDPVWSTPRRMRPAIEFHEPSRSLLVERAGHAELHPSVWIHELVHVSGAGARPESKLGKRVHRAIEEGIADYVAASLAGNPRVGSERSGEVRNLEKPPSVTASDWASLGLPSPFPTHRVGHALASSLWRSAPRPKPSGLVACLAQKQPWPVDRVSPRAVVDELLGRCREPERSALETAIGEVFPIELVRG